MQVERLPAPAICYWPMVLGPWGDPERPAYVVVWLYFYITIWVSGSKGPRTDTRRN